jgi:membrane-bound lytic murein transglycosylase F
MQSASKWLLLGFLVSVIMATSQFEPLPHQQAEALAQARQYQPVEVLVLQNPLTRYQDTYGITWGLDYERLKDFAHHSGLQLKFRVFKNKSALEKALQSGSGRIIISREPLENDDLLDGPALEEVENGVFCNKKMNDRALDNLRIKVVKGPLERTVKQVDEGKNWDCFQSELQIGRLATQTYLKIGLRKTWKTKNHYSWKIRKNSESLLVLLQTWYRHAARSGTLFAPHYRFFSTLNTLDEADIRRFYSRIESVLPDYLSAFQDVSHEVKLPWSLLAAVAYQESQWEASAVSYTGVKGLMQLTKKTAEHMGVTNREDPFQSIWGGSRYLRHLWNEWSHIKNEKDRLMITLASYNIGIAHMLDVIQLLEKKGLPKHSWKHIEKVLPTLEDEDVFENLRYGYARGSETVDFVKRSYSFYQMLSLKRSHF